MHPMTFRRSLAHLSVLALLCVVAIGALTGAYGISSGREIGQAAGAALAAILFGTLITYGAKVAFFRRDRDWTLPFLIGAVSVLVFAYVSYAGMTS